MNAVAAVRPDDASAGERAYLELARRIATGELRAGEPFVERLEAARLGMSRTPLRDALTRLEHDGLVRRVPKRGTFVSVLDSADIADNMALREAIEVATVRTIIEKGDSPDAAIADAMESQRRAISAGDHRAFLDADERFHVSLVAVAGNARAVDAVCRAWLHIDRARYLGPMTATAMRRARRDHLAIAAAVRGGSVEAAQQAIRRHVAEALHHLRARTATMPRS